MDPNYFSSVSKTYTKKQADCNTTYVVYLFECTICKTQYMIGETKRAFKHRLKEHLTDIKYTRDRAVSTHVNKHSNHTGKIIPSSIEIINLDLELQSTTDFRRKREIYKLKTQSPFGLNTFS